MSGLQIRAFHPLGNNKTVNITTTAASQTLAVPDTLGTRAVRVVNSGTDISFLEFTTATGAAAATTTSMPMLGNTVEVFTFPNDVTQIRVIGAAGGSVLYVTYGEGL